LGGSSILNFAVYLYGSADDYNEWARLVGDDSWAWEQTQQSFKAIENYDFSSSSQWPHLAKPDAAAHGKDGTLKLGLPQTFEPGLRETMEALERNGEKINLDMNSGDPIGIGIFPATYSKEGRTTSANAHLVNPPSNLTIWTGAALKQLTFVGTRVVGVETADGRRGRIAIRDECVL
jgi:choline dehydrogenase-like flavoprotein